jgi:isopentenyldiphosphate isomerase
MQDILREDIECIVHSDSEGNIIGPISKNHAHLESVREVLTHYSTWSMIYNLKLGKYGIQLKNPKKHDKYGAGKWDMGVAGHNSYIKEDRIFRPLDFSENLIKEAGEEIGINLVMAQSREEFFEKDINSLESPFGFIFEKFHYKTKINNEWIGLGFVIVLDTKVKFEDDEVVDFRWFSPEELERYLKNNNDYCEPLLLAFDKAEKFRKSLNFLNE